MKPDVKRDNPGVGQTAPKERPHGNRPNLEKALDEALEETFPASDPVSVIQPVKKRREKSGAAGRPYGNGFGCDAHPSASAFRY
jgi:hypothetical protein